MSIAAAGHIRERWAFRLPLPPNQNHMYIPVRGGAKVLTAEARQFRKDVAVLLPRGFRPSLERRYSVMVWFHFPSDRFDIDGCLKALLDACFGSRADHRVYSLHARKALDKLRPRCTVRIAEVA